MNASTANSTNIHTLNAKGYGTRDDGLMVVSRSTTTRGSRRGASGCAGRRNGQPIARCTNHEIVSRRGVLKSGIVHVEAHIA